MRDIFRKQADNHYKIGEKLSDYLKGYFKYDKCLEEYFKNWGKRLFHENAFEYLRKILLNKFLRTSPQKNFTQKSLVNRREFWRDFEYDSDTFDNLYEYDLAYSGNKDLLPENANVFYDFFNVLVEPEFPQSYVKFQKSNSSVIKLYIKDLLARKAERPKPQMVLPVDPLLKAL